ncbi:MAG: M23 family metallopeptidase [Rikenellaceae bacterium]|nr:M23 family metallopeptidase [Rikenellaceae bacterium]
MSNGNIRYFLKNLRRRHRLSMTDSEGREVWYYHQATPLRLAGIGLVCVAVVFVASLLVAAYTKVLDIVPGYDGIQSRQTMIENIIRLDSLERELAYMTVYIDNVAQIMEGKGPVIRSLKPQDQDKITSEKEVVAPSSLDSLLREQLEGSGRYGLNKKGQTDKAKLSNAEILRPVEGSVVEPFSPTDGRFGVVVSVENIQQVAAIQDGTVVLCIWEPDGYTMQIQHSANFLSIYRGLGQAHKEVGSRVKGGQAIGATWNEETAAGNATNIEVELWYDGTAIDPEKYIIF